jgi:hypothetical protein
MTLDYCEAVHATTGSIRLKGYGKKGQSITLENKDKDLFGYGDIQFSGNKSPLTAACLMELVEGCLTFACAPRYYTTGSSTLHDKTRTLNTAGYYECSSSKLTDTSSFNAEASITITLTRDGEFDLYLHNFRELAGAFKNPPGDCFVPYAEDLQRCERYYQTGIFRGMTSLRLNGSNMESYPMIPFRTTMSGTPSVSTSSQIIHLYQDPAAGSGFTNNDEGNWTFTLSDASVSGCKGDFQRSGSVASRSIANCSFTWTAVIS